LEVHKKYKQKNVHPTQKPIELLEYLILTYSNEGDTILDNCMGSGSTGVACMNTGRKFIGVEKEETYFNIAESRIKEASNNLNKFME
jgi:site-specific DNA-methyltransferase (adenine-specific)